MDVALLFFLPLLGGYFFVRSFIVTRYKTSHEETGQVYYRAALTGFWLAVAAAVLHGSLENGSPAYAALTGKIRVEFLVPLFDKSESGAVATSPEHERAVAANLVRSRVVLVCAWAFALGLTAPIWNLLAYTVLWVAHRTVLGFDRLVRRFGWRPGAPRITLVERLIRRSITDDLERVLYEAMVHVEPVQVSLDNSKVYVGIVHSIDPVGPAKHFTMQPLMSGGRDGGGREVRYTSFYDRIIKTVTAAEPARKIELLRRFQIVVPLGRIVTASGFDMAAFKEFELERSRADAAPVKPRSAWLRALLAAFTQPRRDA